MEDPRGLPEEPEGHRRHGQRAREGRGQGVQVGGTVASSAAIPPTAPTPSAGERPTEGKWGNRLVVAAFLLPAVIFLVVWLVYPTIRTIIRSFYDRDGSDFVGF